MLVFLSKVIKDLVEKKSPTTGTQVSKIIYENYKLTNTQFKNLQRRVYDVINVFQALGIFKKEKYKVFYLGIPIPDPRCTNSSSTHANITLREI